ncbi:putative uncharacterized protein (plasmid) [Aliivibrio wodanis]|uniref:Uncharacterized protein n=1 Tax=Aliivibrio wodanis TaxID=80852 RepID=A0A090IE77_9GAMM|nr:putative uncharacterized protein [Aliivibrio wodanis]
MPKYQFFCIPDSNRKKFTFIDMDSDTFLTEKKQLIEGGFEVEDDVIYGDTREDAVEKFKSNYIYHLDEYNNSHVESGFLSFIIELYKEVRSRK